MNKASVISEYNKLPVQLQKEVSDFISFLLYKHNISVEAVPQKTRGGFGILKGKISMSDDFDEPIEDFNKYCVPGML